ncbi:MAG TPA: Stp1/IreP family PP2C-type Ser/Thr phosphatase [Actinomycetota bacterium]|nr:Stp1/IreP family PP2C-type Ser/Thr phosphatase [Actinomycetota bacterium]
MRVVAAAATDIGQVRDGNEDTYVVEEPLFALADGMGGHRGGEVASRIAIETLERLFATGQGTLAELVREANRAVFERSMSDRSVSGMGTTLTAAVLEGDRVRLAHVGDSRAYLLRDGELRQITEDHTLVHRMVTEGELTEAEAEVHPHRNILIRVVGVDQNVDVDELEVDPRPGDRLMLCSDGLHDMLSNRRIAEILVEEPDPTAAVRRLITEANHAGGIDNITVILLDFHDNTEAQGGTEARDPGTETRTIPRPPGPGATGATTGTVGRGGRAETTSSSAEREPPRPPRRPLANRIRWTRVVLWTGVAIAVLVVAFVGFRMYLDTQWYVGVSDGRVAVLRGMPTEVAGFDLHHVVVETTIPAEDAQALALYRDLDEGITANDRAEADAIVERIREDVAANEALPEPAP